MRNTFNVIAVGFFALAYGCANHNNAPSISTSPPTPATDKKLIKSDSQAAELALSRDHQAIMPTTVATTAPRPSDQVVSSLRIAIAQIKPSSIAATQPATQNVEGTVTFTQVGSMLIMVAELSGLQPNSTHALQTAIDDPKTNNEQDDRRAELLGNVDADSTGRVYFERTLGGASIGGDNSIVGHVVILFAQPTTEPGTAPADSNARIASGLIERHDQ